MNFAGSPEVPMPYVHDIDPIVCSIGGLHVWWYGVSYAAGFLNAHLFLRHKRRSLHLSLDAVYELTIFLAAGVLVGGRAVVVFVNEWPFYRNHLWLVPAIWIGGLATHGLIAGGAAGVFAFCRIHRVPVRPVLDALAVSAALILACGRVGNFIDGQIVGTVTSVPWAVKFPDAPGFRHPVVLYDGIKNLLLVPLLLWIGRRSRTPGRVAASFLVLYPALRIPIDLFREYHAEAAATGQMLNVVMASVGTILLVKNVLFPAQCDRDGVAVADRANTAPAMPWRRL